MPLGRGGGGGRKGSSNGGWVVCGGGGGGGLTSCVALTSLARLQAEGGE